MARVVGRARTDRRRISDAVVDLRRVVVVAHRRVTPELRRSFPIEAPSTADSLGSALPERQRDWNAAIEES